PMGRIPPLYFNSFSEKCQEVSAESKKKILEAREHQTTTLLPLNLLLPGGLRLNGIFVVVIRGLLCHYRVEHAVNISVALNLPSLEIAKKTTLANKSIDTIVTKTAGAEVNRARAGRLTSPILRKRTLRFCKTPPSFSAARTTSAKPLSAKSKTARGEQLPISPRRRSRSF
ncbi:MAG: hypothetical protein K2J77_05455, partial [Oscillospiraceae bacterium]|nr:hypothetical protein [Oscillospiraceae bacterium]